LTITTIIQSSLPIDGLITYHQLAATAANDPEKSTQLDLKAEITDVMGMVNSYNQKSITWSEYLDINSVMLATSLAPDAYLMLY